MPDPTARQRLAAQSGAQLSAVVIPPIPYVAPPINPRQMPQWYSTWHAQMEKWREQTNVALQRVTGAPTALP